MRLQLLLKENENYKPPPRKYSKRSVCEYQPKSGTALVDGNHENFNILNSYPVCTWNGGKIHKISNKIYYLMRGQVFCIAGKHS